MKDFNYFKFVLGIILKLDDHELGKLTVKGLARKLNVSKSLLYDLFAIKRFTPAEMLMSLKISRAWVLLITTNASVSEISKKMGFHSPDYFIRIFKGRSGITPGKFKKEMKKNNVQPG